MEPNFSYASPATPHLGRLPGDVARVTPVGVSLEQRLDYLQRGLERLQKVRAHADNIADRLSIEQEQHVGKPPASPSPSDLSNRYGETISFLHENIDSLEQLVQRLDRSLFDSPKAAQAGAR